MDTTLAEIIRPYNRSAIARKLRTGRARVSRWARGQGAPDAHELTALAAILRMDVATLAAIIAADKQRGDARPESDHAA